MTAKLPWYAPLIGRRGTVAMGRLLLLVAFGLACYSWITAVAHAPEAFPGGLQEVIWGLLAYNLGGKFAGRESNAEK